MTDAADGGGDVTGGASAALAPPPTMKAAPPPSVGAPNQGWARRTLESWRATQRQRFAGIDPWNLVCLILLGLLAYATCYLLFGATFLPRGGAWAVIVLWLGAHFGGALISTFGLHPLLGQLLAGIALENIPVAWLVRPLPIPWRAKIRQGALALVFLRSGLELDWATFRRAGPAATRLLLVPGICEALISGSVAHAVFGMPWLLALALGFILKAVGPAIVIQLMFDLQKRGWGVDKGIPALVVAAASFDDLVAIFFYTLFINLAVKGDAAGGGGGGGGGGKALALDLAAGPISILAGFVGGGLMGVLASFTRLWSSRRKRTMAVVVLAWAFMYLMDHFHYDGAGALAALTLGLTASVAWRHGWPGGASATATAAAAAGRRRARTRCARWPRLATGPGPTFARDAEHGVGALWWWVAQPLLFGMIGLNLDFARLSSATADDSLAVIFSGWAPRPLLTFLVVAGAGLSRRERAFVGAAWMPKASVQAALASGPLDAILARGLGDRWVGWGRDIQTTAIFAILICATVGIVAVNALAPVCLNKGPGIDALTGGGGGGGGGVGGSVGGGAATADAEAGVAAPAPAPPGPPPPPLAASPFAAAAAIPPPALSSMDEAAAVEKLKAREAALAQYVEEVDALARFVEGLEPSAAPGPGGGRAAAAARVAKRVRLDALALRKRALADHWLDSAPSALDLFAMDAAMRRRFGGRGRGGGGRGAQAGLGAAGERSSGGTGDPAVAAAAAALGASAVAARSATGGGGGGGGGAPADAAASHPRRLLGRWRMSGDGLDSGGGGGGGEGGDAPPPPPRRSRDRASSGRASGGGAASLAGRLSSLLGFGSGGGGGEEEEGGEGGRGGGGPSQPPPQPPPPPPPPPPAATGGGSSA